MDPKFLACFLSLCLNVDCYSLCIVKLDVKARQVTVTGPRGTLHKDFRHLQIDMIKIGGKRLKVEMWWGKSKQLAAVRTACTHIENMIQGVTKVRFCCIFRYQSFSQLIFF
jgi:hypothetical protein